jgi:hypothetical protein
MQTRWCISPVQCRTIAYVTFISLPIVAAFLLISCGEDKSTTPAKPATVTDIDGNVYKIVTIGTQVWMAENLKVTHYRNGDSVPNVTVDATWQSLTTGAYCE